MSISMNNECLLCLLRRHLQTADKLGDAETNERFAKALLRLYADAPEGISTPWLSDKINGSGATTLRKRSTVIHPKNKRTKDVMHQLEPGDLVGYSWNGNVHTMIYHHKEGNRVYWFTGGSSDFKAKKLIRRRPFYYFKKVDIIVKVKQPD